MPNAEEYLKSLELSTILKEPIIKAIVHSLSLLPDGEGLDVGCGTGFYTMMLTEAAGAHSHVTGLDIEENFLEKGRSLAFQSDMAEQVSFIRGNIHKLPFAENRFDWAFSMDLVGNLKTDPVILLKEIARTVKPGGMVYILNWSSQALLPGYPALEARLNATSLGIAPFEPETGPKLHKLCALEWLKQAGLGETRVQTFVRDIHAPLSRDMQKAVVDLFTMRWGQDNPELSEEDSVEYQRLCKMDSPDFILNNSWYYGFFTYSLFYGQVP